MSSDFQTTTVFFDFLCPYAWRGVEMAAALRQHERPFRLRHFSLVEGNHQANKEELTWRITDQPRDANDHSGQRSSLGAFLAAHAAARQGEEAAWAFTLALYRLHHEQERKLQEDTFQAAAAEAGLDLTRFEQDLQDDAGLRQSLRADLDAAWKVGVFGTPTFVLPTGEAAYFRFGDLTRDPAQAMKRWALYESVLGSDAEIKTIKRTEPRDAAKS